MQEKPDGSNSDQQKPGKEALLQELGAKLVQMGWFVAGSEGLQGTLDFLRAAPENHLQGLINGCERNIAQPSRCGGGPRPK